VDPGVQRIDFMKGRVEKDRTKGDYAQGIIKTFVT
jgi:hypothetical protein